MANITYTVGYKLGLAKSLNYISLSGQTTEWSVGDTFAFDGTVTVGYLDGTTEVLSSGYVVDSSGVNMSAAGTYTVIVSYTDPSYGNTVSASYTITVASSGKVYSHTIAEIASAYSWTDQRSLSTDYHWYFDYENNPGELYCSQTGTSSKGTLPKYWAEDQSIRVYSTTSARGSLSIAAPTGYKITKITVTFTRSASNVYCYCHSNIQLTSGTEYEFANPQASIQLWPRSSSGGYVSGNIHITEISLTCEPDA